MSKKVQITIETRTKEELIKEIQNVLENISRFDRYDPMRTFNGGYTAVSNEGSFAKFEVVTPDGEHISYHETRADANFVAGETYNVLVLNGTPYQY